MATTAATATVVDPPPASPYDGRLTPLGRRSASPAALDRRRANRRDRKVADRGSRVRAGASRELIAAMEPEGPADPYKFNTDAIKPDLRHVACSEPWVDAACEVLNARRPSGKPVVPYAVKLPKRWVDDKGETRFRVDLSTAVPKLIDMLSDHGVYPPAADDPASRMRPCYCRLCAPAGSQRAVLYPATYVGTRGLSYECWIAREASDADMAAMLDSDPDTLYLLEQDRAAEAQKYHNGRRVEVRVPVRVERPNAWREDKIGRLGVSSRTALSAMRGHAWTQVVGDVKAKIVTRRLRTIGDVADYLEMGHKLSHVPGVTPETARDVVDRLIAYDKEPRRGVMEYADPKLPPMPKG